MRRAPGGVLLVGWLVLLAALVACAPAEDGQPASPAPSPPTEPGEVPSIVFAGDSVLRELAAGLAVALEGQAATTYVGLPTISGNHAALAEWRDRLAERPPDLLVVQVGSWEVNAARLAPDGVAGYAASLDPFLEVVADVPVLWLGHPALQLAQEDQALDRLVATWQALPRHHPNVEYLDAGAAVERGGRFTTYVGLDDGRQVLVRQLDGRHLCPDGVVLAGRVVLDALARRFDFVVGDAWETAAWREDREVFAVPALCPAGNGDPLAD